MRVLIYRENGTMRITFMNKVVFNCIVKERLQSRQSSFVARRGTLHLTALAIQVCHSFMVLPVLYTHHLLQELRRFVSSSVTSRMSSYPTVSTLKRTVGHTSLCNIRSRFNSANVVGFYTLKLLARGKVLGMGR